MQYAVHEHANNAIEFGVTEETPTSGCSSWRNWWVLPLLPLMPFYLVLLVPILGGFYVVAESGRRWRARQLRIAMRNAGRTSTWADVESDLASGAGTLIVDIPCAGWNDADIWWTRESIPTVAVRDGITLPTKNIGPIDRAEFEARIKNPVFDRWCRARYFDTLRGTAKLVQCTHWRRDLQKATKRIETLRSAYPRLETAETHSGLIRMAAEAQPAG